MLYSSCKEPLVSVVEDNLEITVVKKVIYILGCIVFFEQKVHMHLCVCVCALFRFRAGMRHM